MKKKILITGSAGFVGSHLVDYVLEKTDWDIVGIDSFRHRGDSVRVSADNRYKVYCADLSAPISQRLLSEIYPINYVVNMASESHVDRSITDPVPFVQNNVNLALNVLEMCRVLDPEHVVQVSTDEVYGPARGKENHKEWSTILPSNPYSASKAAQEAIAFSYWRTFGVPLTVTNTMNMFGPRQDKEKFIPLCISKIAKGRAVTVHGTAECVGSRKYLHARNMADALVWILNKVEPDRYEDGTAIDRPHRFNIVGNVEIDNLTMAQTIAKIMDMPLKFEFIDFHKSRPGHDRRYSLDGSQMELCGWRPPLDFVKSLESTVKWYLENPAWLR